MTDIDQVREWMAASRALAVMTGAGVSTDSGIPDYRGPQGVWTLNPTAGRPPSRERYLADRSLRELAWRNRAAHPMWTARPNVAHTALAALEDTGRMVALVTQNIDGLHQLAGSRAVVELHGSLREAECTDCGWRGPMPGVLARVAAGETDPPCESCGGVLSSATVAFGQHLDPEVLRSATEAATRCELFLVAGSSLTVQPAAGLCRVAVAAGARLVVVNEQPTPYDPLASAVLRGQVADLLPALVEAVA